MSDAQSRPTLSWLFGIGVSSALLGLVASIWGLTHSDWWWGGPDVEVPRDGRTHTVTVSRPGATYAIWSDQSLIDPTCVLHDAVGAEIPLQFVPRAERSVVEGLYVAKPEASFLFTAARDGEMRMRCDDVWARPIQTVGLGPAPDATTFTVMNVGTLLAGPVLFVLGLVIAAAGVAVRLRSPVRHRHASAT